MSEPQKISRDADSPSNLDLQALFHRLNNQLGVLLAQAELLEANRNKVGFLTYGVAISDDRQVFHIYERFQDSAAIINHMQSFGPKFSERFFEILKPTRFVIYGTPSAEVKDAVAPFNPVYMTPLAGFRKHSANDC